MTTAPAMEVHGRRALARLGARLSLIYLGGTASAVAWAAGSGSSQRWAGALVGVQILALTVLAALGMACSEPSARCARRPAVTRAGVVVAGALVLERVVSVGPEIGWPDVQVLAGWVLPGIGLGLALAAGPVLGIAAFCVLAACFALMVPDEAFAAVPVTLAGASVSVMVAALVNATARRGYATTERAIAAAESAAVARARAEQRVLGQRRLDRVLHDTVLSTLTLLAHGGQGVDPDRLRVACRRDLAALRSELGWATGSAGDVDAGRDRSAARVPRQQGPMEERLAAVRELAARLGVDLRVHLPACRPDDPSEEPSHDLPRDLSHDLPHDPPRDPASGPGPAGPGVLDPVALEAWASALAECVTNIGRHAGVAAADVVLGRTATTLVTLVLDEGSGFETGKVRPERLGLSGSVSDRLQDVGGRARIWSRPGEGTVVELILPLPGPGAGPAGEPPAPALEPEPHPRSRSGARPGPWPDLAPGLRTVAMSRAETVDVPGRPLRQMARGRS